MPVVAGGPLFTTGYEEFEGVAHFVLGEGEVTFPLFLEDLEKGVPRHIYNTDIHPDISGTPVPRWDLINVKNYLSMSVQYSRGCPFQCEFCDIVIMNGRIPRAKSTGQLLGELEAIHKTGWRGKVFIVDDNFIGKKEEVKALLPEIINWQKAHHNPFYFITEASINLADDEELMKLMHEARFQSVFIGIETPNEDSLSECSKFQNGGRDLVSLVKKIQRHGLEVMGGFIVGFDHDTPSIFEKQINLIQKSGVVIAMVGILNALPGTKLYHRLKSENRLLKASTGDNVNATINFKPAMDIQVLTEGYKKILKTIYSPREYCERVITFLREYEGYQKVAVQWTEIRTLLRSVWFLGIVGKSKRYYWKVISWTLIHRPRLFPMAVALIVVGAHFQKIALQ